MTELSPIRVSPSDWDEMEYVLLLHFKNEIYLPLLEILRLPHKILNAPRSLLTEAIVKGRIRYEDGILKGKFSSGISKEIKALGGQWNRKHQAWAIDLRNLPMDVRTALAYQQQKLREVLTRIDSFLGKVDPGSIPTAKMNQVFKATLNKFEDEFIGSIKKTLTKEGHVTKWAEKHLTLPYELTPDRKAAIARDYTNNMEKPIKEFTEKMVIHLREKVQAHTYKGLRWDGLVSEIENSYKVSARKAKFLARQETHLLMSAYKKDRYLGMGITQYRWRCVTGTQLHPVRPIHRQLNDRSLRGELFDFNDPPVTSPDGRRNNPSEDFNCRCVSIPVVR